MSDRKRTKKETIKLINEMETKLEIEEQKTKKNRDHLLRVSAEFENYKKRSAREMNEFKKFSNEPLIKELFSAVDNLELALKSLQNSKQADTDLIEGINMILKGMLNTFEKFGVKPIESLGKLFNPSFHHAIVQEETNECPKNTVINEMQKGYTMHDKLIRPAMVTVSTTKII